MFVVQTRSVDADGRHSRFGRHQLVPPARARHLLAVRRRRTYPRRAVARKGVHVVLDVWRTRVYQVLTHAFTAHRSCTSRLSSRT